ncbi:MAG: hypothetical protein IT424_13560 [Pirellulales bacterium]|nr:hypothetical protein [Pirellulales bacterium]
MSSLFNVDWQTRPVRWSLALLAMLAGAPAFAQQAVEGDSLASAVEGRAYSGTAPLRIEHRTRGYAQEASDTAVGGRLGFVDMADAVGFADGQFRINNESRVGLNAGLGYRWYNENFLTGDTRILGVSGWYDGQETVNNNYFNQLGVSLESLGEFIDLRLNANIPLEERKLGDQVFMTDALSFFGNSIGQQTLTPTDTALRVVDFEAAARVFDLNIWVYGGGYQMDGEGVSDMGAKGGVRGYLTNDLLVGVTVTDDQVFGTNTIAQVIWTPGRVGSGPTSWVHSLADRMREHVYRNTYVATQQSLTAGTIALTAADGEALRVVHVDSTATAPGDGTFERPLTSLDSVKANSQQGDVVLVHAGTSYSGQTAVLQDEQRLLGEGGGNTHTVATAERGTITLPESTAGATNLARPTITGGAGENSIVLAGSSGDTSTFDAIEVSNFTITGGQSAIFSAGVGSANINRLQISNTTGNAIELTALTETLANNSQNVRFTPTIDQVDFDNVGGDDIVLNSVTEPSANAITEAIALSSITSEGGNGVGINLQNTRRTVAISNISWDGNAVGDGAIRVQGAGTQAAITLNGTNSIREGQATSPDDSGFGISLENSNGTMTVAGTTITNTGGDSVIVNGGDVDLNFTGRIVQDNASAATATTSVVSVLGGHTGALTFTELTAGEGVVSAVKGDGMQFDEADGVYTFNDEVELAGTVNAVNVTGDSEAVLTFQNAQFSNTTGTTLNFDGGDANMTLTGRIVQGANNAVLNVTNGHTGTLAFNEFTNNQGVISATNGTGLQFANADGAYTFNDEVTLNGGDAGIDVLAGNDATNGSDGTFTFANANIDYNGGGVAVDIDDSSVQAFTLSGDVDVTNGRPVAITNNTGGSITINATIDSTDEGILVNNNTSTTINFAGQATLNTAANEAVTVSNNTNGGVTFDVLDIDTTTADGIAISNNTNSALVFDEQTTVNVTGAGDGVTLTDHTGGSARFDALDVTTTSGTALLADNTDNLTVAGAGNTLTTSSGTALNLNDVQVAATGMTFDTVAVGGAAGAGVALNDVRGGAVTINGGTVTATGAGAASDAVRITNAANVSLNNMTLASTNGQGLDFNANTSATSRLRFENNTVNQTAGAALEGALFNIDQSASQVFLTVSGNEITHAGDEDALRLQTAGVSAKTVTILMQNNAIETGSANAADAAANVQVGGGATLNATVRNNTFTNTGAGSGLEVDNLQASSRTRLDLDSNEASGTANDFLLEETAGVFTLQDEATVQTRNTGTVTRVGTIDEEAGTIPTP